MLAEAFDDAPSEAGSEGPEDAARSAAQGWEWVYDEATARLELEESSARTEHHTSLWGTTTKNAAAIEQHVSRLIEDRSQGDFEHRAGGEGEGWDFMSKLPATFDTFAGKMTRKKQRFESQEMRWTARGAEQKRKKEAMASHSAAADARLAERQRETHENQRKRAFVLNQRRSEQQKTLRETQREKDRIWEDYYVKHQVKLKEEAALALKPKSASMPALVPRVGGVEDIHRSVQKSHGKYVDQLDQWKSFVIENDRKNDAAWKKVLQGSSKAELLGETAADRLKKNMAETLRNTVTSSLLASWTHAPNAAESSGALEEITLKPASAGTFARPDAATWRPRRQQCIEHAAHLVQAADDKRNRDTQVLLDARDRYAQGNGAKVQAALDNSRQWKLRFDEATAKRLERDIVSDDNLVQKHADHAARLAAFREEKGRNSDHRLELKDEKIAKYKEQKEQLCADKVSACKGDLEKLHDAASDRVLIAIAAAKNRAERDDFQQKVDQAQERKRAALKGKVGSAKKEIAAKAKRSARALENQRSTIMDKERARRKAAAEVARTAASIDVAATSPASATSSGPLSPGAASDATLLPRIASPPPLSPLKSPTARRPDASEPSEPSEDEGSDGDETEEFLEMLGSRCNLWLADLRRNKREIAC